MFKEISALVGVIVGAIALVFGLSFLGYKSYEFFAPKYRQVDNQVFKESEQYNTGMKIDFDNLMLQYQTTTDEAQKSSIKAIIIHRFAAYDTDKLNSDQRQFYYQLKRQ